MPASGKSRRYEADDDVWAVVRGFEDCTLPPAAFDHGAHLAVALSYIQAHGLTEAGACARMREGLRRYLEHNGVDGAKYNETVTLFWVRRVRWAMGKLRAGGGFAETADGIIERCGGSRLIFDYYSRERVNSDEARQGWAEPDLRPLDF